MDTLEALASWNRRHANPVAAVPLREIAARQGAQLRKVGSTGRKSAERVTMEARVAAVRVTQAAPAPTARPAVASVNPGRLTFRQVDALAAQVPVGYYCLPRTRPSESGATVTFFKVSKFRGGHRIVQLVGGVGAYAEQSLRLEFQAFALRHILEDVAAAAALYGREAKECGFCRGLGRHSPLTHERSRKAGYGQHCADKYGLPW